VCVACTPGFFSALGSSSCGPSCAPGSGQAVTPSVPSGSSQCRGCLVCSALNSACAPDNCPPCSVCRDCVPGQFSTGSGSCKACPAGECNQPASKDYWPCFLCTNGLVLVVHAGTFAPTSGTAVCAPCPVGQVSGPGASTCDVKCALGTGTRTSNLKACVPCASGAVNNSSGKLCGA
jgi:hypothetical protein